MGPSTEQREGDEVEKAGSWSFCPIADATFPASAPHPEADVVLSVHASDRHYFWAIHEGRRGDYRPSLFWRCVARSVGDGIGNGARW